MKFRSIVLSGLITLTSISMQAAKLIKKVEASKNPSDIVIPYTQYQLDNGLTVILHEDHSDPIVHVDVTYHVGSAREEIGKSGFAHFFEHMMFQGSKNVADEEHFKIVQGAGGTMNGTTNRDRTNYFETIPKNYLETALWLEADRMGFLLEAVTQQKFEVQRATVKNEKGQRYENVPYGMVSEIAGKNFYPFGHPYSWLTIGYIEDLNRVNVDDLKKFFLRWYGPNNAVVTIGGDFNLDEALKMVEKYFGSIPKGPEVKKQTVASFKLEKDRYISYEDNVRFPMLRVSYPTVPNYHPDEAPLDVLAEIIGGGKSSLMYQNFVKPKKALQARSNHPCSELAGDFTFTVLTNPGTSLSETERELRKTIEQFLEKGVSDEDIQKVVSGQESQRIFGLESVNGKVSQLAAYFTFTGDANMIGKDLDRYRKVKKEDIIRVYNQYIKGQKGLFISVYPKGQKNLIAAPDNFIAGGDTSKVKPDPSYAKLTPRIAKDNFDRSKRPVVGASPVVSPPQSYTIETKNGIKGIGTYNNEVPTVYMSFKTRCGKLYQPKGKEGVVSLLTKLMQESTKKYTAEAFESELEKLGSSVNISSDEEFIYVTISSLTKNIKATFDLASEMMLNPKFDKEEFEFIKKQHLEQLANQKNQATVIANATFNRLLYGSQHAMGIVSSGTMISVNSITLEDAKDYYNKYFAPNLTKLVVSGSVTQSDVEKLLTGLNSWERKTAPQMNNGSVPKIEKTKIYLLHKEKAPQSEIRIGYLAMPYDAYGEFFKASVMNYILGGAFNSRINLNLREDKGYTYGARSGFSGDFIAGPYNAYAGVRADATAESVKEFMKEIKMYVEGGIKEDELAYTKSSILEREALKYESNTQKAGYLSRMIDYNLTPDYNAKQADILKSLTVSDINGLAKKHLPLDKMVILVVGDAPSNKSALEALGYEVVEYKEDLF